MKKKQNKQKKPKNLDFIIDSSGYITTSYSQMNIHPYWLWVVE